MSLEDRIDELFSELAAVKEQLEELNNGKFEDIRKAMAQVAAESRVVVNTVQTHGDLIVRLERILTRLDLRCPLMKPDTSEFENVGKRVCKEVKEDT
jgi:hypothetical protein